MTMSEFNSLMTRIDAVGAENREDVRSLTAELRSTRASLAACQARCWVGDANRRENRRFLFTLLAAFVAAGGISWLQHFGR